jgi:hypothetical protein
MTPQEIRPLLAGYRTAVQQAWTVATAQDGYDAAPGSPVGQCGVTSAWLQHQLNTDHGIATDYFEGSVWLESKRLTDDYCWLQVDDIILDLTADQYGLNETVCGYWRDLTPVYLGRPGNPPVNRLRLLGAAL